MDTGPCSQMGFQTKRARIDLLAIPFHLLNKYKEYLGFRIQLFWNPYCTCSCDNNTSKANY